MLRLINEGTDSDITINFEHTEIFEANLAAILGAIYDSSLEQHKAITYVNFSKNIREAFNLNSFLPDPSIILNTHHKGTVLSYMKFTPYKDQVRLELE